ncbi:helix-turn-helix domain-containing protein [Amycolatopsis rhabdoformis]|uniref:Helix-turn-helix domain-containing protein n=1 Tax=Amycolatopsis rhabdoformis TaxID=1448059 RepID=A0ABZ1IHV4_9PSEU|nr:helix-turn-helix domain-containing protein [Amycolatopsis rhabdoformis]WSE33714.1 helix-turn-helix domain-containing protein [Amycolatopsis rhabdoformis]
MTNTGRSLRADARENQDRILEAAARAFSRDGADTSLKAIAKEAGVGIATLYRRFPAREDLVEATYRSETERLAASAADLLAELAPEAALRAWMDRFVDYMLTKNGMAEALPGILAAREGLRAHSRDLLRAAIDRMLTAAAEAGALRADVPADDVMMAIGGVTLIAGHEDQRELAARLLDLVVAGLRAG